MESVSPQKISLYFTIILFWPKSNKYLSPFNFGFVDFKSHLYFIGNFKFSSTIECDYLIVIRTLISHMQNIESLNGQWLKARKLLLFTFFFIR